MEYLVNKLTIKEFKKIDFNRNLFFSLFIDEKFGQGYINFTNGYIDAFSAKNMAALKDDNTPLSIKESILSDQNKFMQILKSLEIDMDLSDNVINDITKYRREIQ